MVLLKDIARELGLSIGAVSMALNDSPRISDKTIKKVRQAAKEMGYTPNNIGRALQSGKSSLIGCVLSSLKSSFWIDIFDGISQTATTQNYAILSSACNSSDNKSTLKSIDLLLSKNVDGMIIANNLLLENQKAIKRLETAKVPFVFCSHDCSDKGFAFVVTDDKKGGNLAAQHLLDMGHRSILCEHSQTQYQRIRGNLEIINACAGAKSFIFYENDDILKLVKLHSVTAIIAYSDIHALDLIFLLKSHGYRVPEDISVIGYDNLNIAARPEFMLTSVGQQRYRLGQEAVGYLTRKFKGKNPPKQLYLEPELICRNTVKNLKANY
jgi:LacI family transcriptional regulator, galactose operon repressor